MQVVPWPLLGKIDKVASINFSPHVMKKFLTIIALVSTLLLSTCGSQIVTLDSGLVLEDLKVGSGEEAESGDTIDVNYKGYYEDGTEFENTYKLGQSFIFPLGIDGLIQGWEQGIPGMKVGGIRKLTVPPELGYGEQGSFDGSIPPNTTLIFEIELVGLQ